MQQQMNKQVNKQVNRHLNNPIRKLLAAGAGMSQPSNYNYTTTILQAHCIGEFSPWKSPSIRGLDVTLIVGSSS